MNFKIKEITSIKLVDKKGNEIQDIRDKVPILKETKIRLPIMELILIHTIVPLEWANKEPFCKYGYLYCGICDIWSWDEEKLKFAPEIELWKMYGLCQEYWCNKYEYWYNKEVKEFRNYRRKNGEDLSSIITP